jgi:hypothetical protein
MKTGVFFRITMPSQKGLFLSRYRGTSGDYKFQNPVRSTQYRYSPKGQCVKLQNFVIVFFDCFVAAAT